MTQQTAVARRPSEAKRAGWLTGSTIFYILTLSLGGPQVSAQTDTAGTSRLRAPDFADAGAWLNTDRPLSLKALRGQVVLVDFWTYCCINCMHVFPDLKYLEKKYHDQPFVVVGVHSGKFSKEKDAENIRQAILRHNLAHPVAVDSDYKVWNAYAVRAWPTLVLIDPEGYVVGQVSGEGHRDALDRAIGTLLAEHRKRGTLTDPLRFKLERETFTPGVLQFPGKVLADAVGKRLFISDTNHHRVLATDLDGKVQHVIGSGEIGLRDGPFETARFYQPQGLAMSEDRNKLYVADTENHAVREVDLRAKTVRTVAGTGRQSYDYRASGPGVATALSSPWDLARVGSQLYVAMAGTHQIWVLDLDTERVSVFAGTGREAGFDGPNRVAAFAQPSGLVSDGKSLYVADSEISTIRAVELKPDGRTSTVAGSGELFEFGARDGVGSQARFQHPLGVALRDDALFVADTFNDSIRRIDLRTRAVMTWLDDHDRSEVAGASGKSLFEPGGLSIAGDTLYVADTNHHRVVALDLRSKRARVVEIVLPD